MTTAGEDSESIAARTAEIVPSERITGEFAPDVVYLPRSAVIAPPPERTFIAGDELPNVSAVTWLAVIAPPVEVMSALELLPLVVTTQSDTIMLVPEP